MLEDSCNLREETAKWLLADLCLDEDLGGLPFCPLLESMEAYSIEKGLGWLGTLSCSHLWTDGGRTCLSMVPHRDAFEFWYGVRREHLPLANVFL